MHTLTVQNYTEKLLKLEKHNIEFYTKCLMSITNSINFIIDDEKYNGEVYMDAQGSPDTEEGLTKLFQDIKKEDKDIIGYTVSEDNGFVTIYYYEMRDFFYQETSIRTIIYFVENILKNELTIDELIQVLERKKPLYDLLSLIRI